MRSDDPLRDLYEAWCLSRVPMVAALVARRLVRLGHPAGLAVRVALTRPFTVGGSPC